MRSALKRAAQDKRIPILGICIGMQILMDSSEEGEGRGLGLIKGRVRKLSAPGLKIPHMGWNSVKVRKGNRLFDKLEAENRFYFVHSFAADTESKDDVLAETAYGGAFCSAIERHNVYGVQFHPEKATGLACNSSKISARYPMLFKRIIPVLLLNDGSLVKTVNFRNADYIGDPCNTAKIFNELNADELIVLDIGKARQSCSRL